MGSWPLAQPLFYQHKRTVGSANVLQGNGSAQSWSMRRRAWRQINNLSRFSTGGPTGRAAARRNLGHHPSPINAGECPVTAAAGERPCPPPPHRTRSGGRPSPTEALRRLQTRSRSAQTKDCKRFKRNSGLGPWSKRMDLAPISADPCPHERNARPETPLFFCTFSCRQEKKFSTLPRTLAITDRGDRIRTCDLVLPKRKTGFVAIWAIES